MKKLRLISICCAAVLVLGGCKPTQKTLSERDLKEAKALSEEARFAMSMREWTRAEDLLLKAIKITPEAAFFHNLGSTRMRLGNRAGAKEAYLSAMEACDRWADVNKADTEPLLKKVQLLAILGRLDDARALLKKLDKDFPADRAVRAFVDGKGLDALVASPTFKEIAL